MQQALYENVPIHYVMAQKINYLSLCSSHSLGSGGILTIKRTDILEIQSIFHFIHHLHKTTMTA